MTDRIAPLVIGLPLAPDLPPDCVNRVVTAIASGTPVKVIIATTTGNCIDLVTAFLTHYQRLDIEHALVMDFDSTDGTRDVLTSDAWKPFVTLVPFPASRVSTRRTCS